MSPEVWIKNFGAFYVQRNVNVILEKKTFTLDKY